MRVWVHFQPKKYNENYEGSRLRKTIKGALDIVGVPYVTNPYEKYDILHVLSCEDELKINDAKAAGIPVVFSALMCEGDPEARLLTCKNNKISIASKIIKILNKCDLIIVPLEIAKELLISNGVETEIKVLSSGVNIARFDYSKPLEKEIVYRYFQLEKRNSLVICVGDYDDETSLENFVKAAEINKDAYFLFFGQSKKWFSLKKRIRKLIRHSPKNVLFKSIVPEDVYRSAVLNAEVFLIANSKKVGTITILDALASKTQIIMCEELLFKDNKIDNDVIAYSAKNKEELGLLIQKYLQHELRSTIDKGYKQAQKRSLQNVGLELKWIYQSLLNEKK